MVFVFHVEQVLVRSLDLCAIPSFTTSATRRHCQHVRRSKAKVRNSVSQIQILPIVHFVFSVYFILTNEIHVVVSGCGKCIKKFTSLPVLSPTLPPTNGYSLTIT